MMLFGTPPESPQKKSVAITELTVSILREN